MKCWFAICLAILPSAMLAQSYDLQIINTSTEMELEGLSSVEAVQENFTDQELNLRMELLEISAPLTWEITLCSPNFCATSGEYDMLYQLDSAQHGIVKVSFSPGLETGSAAGKWVMTNVDQPSETDTIDVSASTLVSLDDLNKIREVRILNVGSGVTIETNGIFSVNVISRDGRLIESHQGNSEILLTSQTRSPSVYFLEITTDTRRLVRRVLF